MSMRNDWKIILFVAVAVGGGLSLFASSAPDGLQKIAELQGFLGNGKRFFAAAIPGYVLPGVADKKLATSISGIIGTLSVFLLLVFIGKFLYRVGEKER